MNGTQYTLVGPRQRPRSGLDITNMTILYGVKANAHGSRQQRRYLHDCRQVTGGALWSNVISVMVQLTFTNPLYAPNPAQQPQTFEFNVSSAS